MYITHTLRTCYPASAQRWLWTCNTGGRTDRASVDGRPAAPPGGLCCIEYALFGQADVYAALTKGNAMVDHALEKNYIPFRRRHSDYVRHITCSREKRYRHRRCHGEGENEEAWEHLVAIRRRRKAHQPPPGVSGRLHVPSPIPFPLVLSSFGGQSHQLQQRVQQTDHWPFSDPNGLRSVHFGCIQRDAGV